MFDLNIFETAAAEARCLYFIYNCILNDVEYLNSAFRAVWGHEFTTVPQLLDHVRKEDRSFVKSICKQLCKEPFNETIEFSIELPDKSIRYLSANCTSVTNAKKKVEWITGFIFDVSDKKKLQESVYDYAAKKNSMLEMLEHDIGGHLKMLMSIASSFSEENIQHRTDKLFTYAKSIQDLSKSTMDLISDLVKKELLDSSNAPLLKERMDVIPRIKSLFSIFKSSEELIKKEFRLSYSGEEIYAEVDDIKFMQVLNNLMYNSIKFTQENGVISLSIQENEHTILFKVEDNGIGIPVKFHEIIFQEHTPAARIGLKGEKTTGIGLSIVKRIVEMHKGKIWLESTEGKGTIFYVEIPKR